MLGLPQPKGTTMAATALHEWTTCMHKGTQCCSACHDETLDELRAQVDSIEDADLLRTFAALTHRLHESDSRDNRAQRDLVQAEILRRMA